MRLLNTSTLTLKYFPSDIPKYAILSHRWEEEEVLYDDIRDGVTDKVKALKGYNKVRPSCEVARQEGYDYIWIDTCCIDKASSAELSESINSMFTWYRNAAVCYAYLSDIHPRVFYQWESPPRFTSSRWFTRGWTLQELVAPSTVVFYNSRWEPIGDKAELCRAIQERTGIPSTVLVCVEPLIGDCGSCSGGRMGFIRIGEGVTRCSHHISQGHSLSHVLQSCSVAQRMSWASRRNTTRVEDAAYCLLGIFGVNMPLLYGEGMRAFLRLQEEIIKTTDDQSILAFARSGPEWPFEGQDSLLAETPLYFAEKGNISPVAWADKFPMTPSSKSINIEMTLCPLTAYFTGAVPEMAPLPVQMEREYENPLWLGVLSCANASVHLDPLHPTIVLQELDRDKSIFRRVYSNRIFEVGFSALKRPVKITFEKHPGRYCICDAHEAVQKNIHLLLMSKEPQDQVQQVSPFRCLLITGTPGNLKCRYSFSGLDGNRIWGPDHNHEEMRRGRTFSMQPMYEYKGYDLCGVLAFDWDHTPSAAERFLVFYGGFKGDVGWCKIASTATISDLGQRHGFTAHTDRCWQERVENKGVIILGETPRAWEYIVGLRGSFRSGKPGKESEEPSEIAPECSLTASVEQEVFLGHYKHLNLVLATKMNVALESSERPPQNTRREIKKGKKN